MLEELSKYGEKELKYHLDKTEEPVAKRFYQLALEKYEPILMENPNRYVLYPIQYQQVWEEYKKAQGSFWTAAEVSLSDDVLQWKVPLDSPVNKIDAGTREFVKQILGFFSQFDLIINQNLATNFINEVTPIEIQMFYSFQIAIENVHSEQYADLINAYIESPSEKEFLFRSIETMPSVKKMANWAFKWMNRDRPFCERIVAFACVEGIMFSGPFAGIYYLKKRSILPGLCQANELISRDEGQHAWFACLLNSLLKYPASDETIQEIVSEATELEIEFINESIPCRLVGMNSELMTQYIKYVSDQLLGLLGVAKIYNTTNPFSFMDLISIDNKTNFFEKRVSEYSRAGFTSKGQGKKEKIRLLSKF